MNHLHPTPPPNVQANAGLRRLLLPTLRADFRLIETWRPAGDAAAEPPLLRCAVAALGGTQDPRWVGLARPPRDPAVGWPVRS